jgi:thermitase
MNQKLFLLFLVSLLLVGGITPDGALASNAPASPGSNNHQPINHIPNQILVQFNDSVSRANLNEHFDAIKAKERARIENINAVLVDVAEGEMESAIDYLRNQTNIKAAEPNYIVTAQETIPNDPAWDLQYGLRNIRAPQGWSYSTWTGWVTIAIIDSGVDRFHPDLVTKTLAGYDFVNNDNDPQDDYGHGTHVAGIAAAASNNGIGIAGASWGAQIMPIKVLNASGNGTYANVANGIIWAVDNGAQVINLSLGGPAYSAILESAVDYAFQRGVVLVAASGNAGGSSVYYPARYTQVIAVGATDSSNQRGAFSNFGDGMEVVAPGVAIYSTELGGGYSYRNGTSMAAPFVSGLAAILIGQPGNYNAGLVREQIRSSALDLGSPGWDAYYGHGLIQMDAALALVPATPTPTLTPADTPSVTPGVSPTGTSTTFPTLSVSPSPYIPRSKSPTPIPVNTKTGFTLFDIPFFSKTATTSPTGFVSPESTPTLTYAPTTESAIIISTEENIEIVSQNLDPIDKSQDASILLYAAGCFLGSGLILFGYALFLFKAERRKYGKYK